jgi:hypothetical protein
MIFILSSRISVHANDQRKPPPPPLPPRPATMPKERLSPLSLLEMPSLKMENASLLSSLTIISKKGLLIKFMEKIIIPHA